MRRDSRITVAIALVVVVALLNLPLPAALRIKSGARDGVAVFQNGLTFAVHRTTETVLYLMDSSRLMVERRRMEQEIARLRYQLQQSEPLARQNRELRRLLDFKHSSHYDLLPCTVIGRHDTSGWWQTLRLNRGHRDGVKENMAVVVPEGLLGRTRDVTARTCDVLLVADPHSRISCRLATTHAFGIVQGGGVTLGGEPSMDFFARPESLRMDYLPRNEPIPENDRVVTSGLGGIYPEGLTIGHIETAGFSESDLYRTARIIPAVDAATVERAFIVMEHSE